MGFNLTIKINPKSSKNEVVGWQKDENNNWLLKVFVTTVPENGKANKALINLLSKTIKISKSSINIVSGETNRIKILAFNAEEEYVLSKLPIKE